MAKSLIRNINLKVVVLFFSIISTTASVAEDTNSSVIDAAGLTRFHSIVSGEDKNSNEFKDNRLTVINKEIEDTAREITKGLDLLSLPKTTNIDMFDVSPEVMAEIMKTAPKNEPRIWVLISSSMSKGMIEDYIKESQDENVSLVYKGVPDGYDMGKFIAEYVTPFQAKGLSANMIIDPRLFDAFEVEQVPAFVYSKMPACNDLPSKDDSHKCAPVEESSYCKLYGAVTLDWAKKKLYEECSFLKNQ